MGKAGLEGHIHITVKTQAALGGQSSNSCGFVTVCLAFTLVRTCTISPRSRLRNRHHKMFAMMKRWGKSKGSPPSETSGGKFRFIHTMEGWWTLRLLITLQ